ncbi:Leucine carboxyl methyltransferase eukaryotic [Penicillium mononematosum]|uniref:Leucine carboxyl methyltransferase eukaryotic n=1 Tax=Penicillium mononematosum TaxID=268346 RepID=UPI002548E2E1|nr:Leucine carboxyl methyltransferase eukaryotic [Penicillium mononematosum]KAJ6191096.1 Leucine carboxyl methyltransferase eukaryotic [Penicillium mononematosum]
MISNILTFSLLAGSALAVPAEPDIEKRVDCPSVHIFGARETTVSPGYGSSSTVVNGLLSAYSGSTAEAISYPACGGQSSCGGVSYSNSVAQGIAAVASAVNSYNKQCPSTKLVLVGYSQGGEIMDAALCGGGVPNQGYTNTAVQLSTSAVNMVKAAIFMGDPLLTHVLLASLAPGHNGATHQGYGAEYGAQAIAFAKNSYPTKSSKLPPFPMATHIPNLNTLRRGRGRGRGIGRTEEAGFPSGKDRIVQGTDNDASVSRLSAVELGYLEDAYAAALTPPGSATRRLPIINRESLWLTGTPPAPQEPTPAQQPLTSSWRVSSARPRREIHTRNRSYLSGAGSDTRVFRLLSSRQTPDFVYHELDFAVNTAEKIRAIRSAPVLQNALGIDSSQVSWKRILELPCRRPATRSIRRRTIDPAAALPGVETGLPTLLISECCLVYLSPAEAEQVVAFFTQRLFGHGRVVPGTGDGLQEAQMNVAPLGLVLYEPIRPNDAFGRTMVSNLAARGIQLKTLSRYASLEAQRDRFQDQGFGDGQAAADIEFIWKRWVNEDEKERVAGLEMLDEMEEWQLLARHYCIAWGWRDRDDIAAFAGWKDLEGQRGE